MMNNNTAARLNAGNYLKLRQSLADSGLNMLEALSLGDLPDSIQRVLVEVLPATLHRESCVLVVGNSGPGFWQHLVACRSGDVPQATDSTDIYTGLSDHPVDQYALNSTQVALQRLFAAPDYRVLFPDQTSGAMIPLQQLGVMIGWHHRSPLGIGIHPQKGLWFAYRAVVVVPAERAFLDSLDKPASAIHNTAGGQGLSATCRECRGQPCISDCPAGALSAAAPPDMVKCIAYRSQQGSPCAATCIARMACPVGTGSRYSETQIAYHYEYSLQSMKR